MWVRDIELKPEQHAELLAKNPAYNQLLSGRKVAVANRRAERMAYQRGGREAARTDDMLHMAGCMLYWAEGGKVRNQLRFTNSDPEMVRFFVKFLRECFGIGPAEIRITAITQHIFGAIQEYAGFRRDAWLE